jgi:hypothetical protein
VNPGILGSGAGAAKKLFSGPRALIAEAPLEYTSGPRVKPAPCELPVPGLDPLVIGLEEPAPADMILAGEARAEGCCDAGSRVGSCRAGEGAFGGGGAAASAAAAGCCCWSEGGGLGVLAAATDGAANERVG